MFGGNAGLREHCNRTHDSKMPDRALSVRRAAANWAIYAGPLQNRRDIQLILFLLAGRC
jgi:hypothetical protein